MHTLSYNISTALRITTNNFFFLRDVQGKPGFETSLPFNVPEMGNSTGCEYISYYRREIVGFIWAFFLVGAFFLIFKLVFIFLNWEIIVKSESDLWGVVFTSQSCDKLAGPWGRLPQQRRDTGGTWFCWAIGKVVGEVVAVVIQICSSGSKKECHHHHLFLLWSGRDGSSNEEWQLRYHFILKIQRFHAN